VLLRISPFSQRVDILDPRMPNPDVPRFTDLTKTEENLFDFPRPVFPTLQEFGILFSAFGAPSQFTTLAKVLKLGQEMEKQQSINALLRDIKEHTIAVNAKEVEELESAKEQLDIMVRELCAEVEETTRLPPAICLQLDLFNQACKLAAHDCMSEDKLDSHSS